MLASGGAVLPVKPNLKTTAWFGSAGSLGTSSTLLIAQEMMQKDGEHWRENAFIRAIGGKEGLETSIPGILSWSSTDRQTTSSPP